jgi:hypothetical protein
VLDADRSRSGTVCRVKIELNDRRWSQVWVPAAVYLALALAWSWPLPIHLTNRFTHDPGDPLLVTYLIWWNAHAVPFTASYWNAPFYWPMRDALALTEHLAGLSPITTPLQWLGASPLLAYNFVLIAATWWTGLATHALVKRLTSSAAAAYCGGIAFAFAPYRTSQLGHLQLYACWWLPLTLLALHAYYDDRRIKWLLLLGAAWLLQGLTNGYYLLFVPILIGLWLVWFTRRRQLRAAFGVLAALAAAAVPAFPFLLKYRALQGAQGLSRSAAEMVQFSARPVSFLSATPLLRFWETREPITTELYLFPGVTALLLVIAGVFVARRDTRFAFYVVAVFLMTLLCTGPAPGPVSIASLWHPYSLLAWLPGFSGLRVPARFFMLAVLCLAIAAGLSFSALERRFPRHRPWLLILVIAGLTVDGAIGGMPLGVPPPQLRLKEPGARVLALPFGEGRVSVLAMYQSMTHRLPVVNGYAGYVPSHAEVIDWALRRRDPSILRELRRGHPLYILIAPAADAEMWTQFVDAQADATMLGIEGGGRLYRMPAAAFATDVRPGTAISSAAARMDGEWIRVDLQTVQIVRGLELRTNGYYFRLPNDLRIEVSVDGTLWETAFEDQPGGLALAGSLQSPRFIPIRIDLRDRTARFVRVNAPAFGSGAVTIYGP